MPVGAFSANSDAAGCASTASAYTFDPHHEVTPWASTLSPTVNNAASAMVAPL